MEERRTGLKNALKVVERDKRALNRISKPIVNVEEFSLWTLRLTSVFEMIAPLRQ